MNILLKVQGIGEGMKVILSFQREDQLKQHILPCVQQLVHSLLTKARTLLSGFWPLVVAECGEHIGFKLELIGLKLYMKGRLASFVLFYY